ncbi:hypothetical protein R1sor_016551 [Riccia sorocarpa]|uniref:Endonuclease/exonuclease/phosphatase domain-containing protein n=1 Tax=Riccia sorocarpa TaxID=122646 RepID=A0ABD3HFC6_9MARC
MASDELLNVPTRTVGGARGGACTLDRGTQSRGVSGEGAGSAYATGVSNEAEQFQAVIPRWRPSERQLLSMDAFFPIEGTLGNREIEGYTENRDARTPFWAALGAFLPTGEWILAGDWNSVQNQDDSSSLSNRQGEVEATEFQNVCNLLNLKEAREVALIREGPRFSRGQTREGRFIWSRIDRFYVATQKVQKLIHHVNFWLSDHIPISLEVDWDGQQDRGGQSRGSHQVSSAYFKADKRVVEENLQHLQEVWARLQVSEAGESSMETFLRCWAGIRGEIKKLQYAKAQQLQLLPDREVELQQLLRKKPEDLSPQDQIRVGQLMSEVRELQAWRPHRWRQTSREKFIRDGDACTNYFFQRFRRRRARTTIEVLQMEDGRNIEDPEQIKREVYRSYRDLYAVPETDGSVEDARAELLRDLSSRISPEQSRLLDDDPTEGEIKESLALLPTGKSPGPDGMGTDILLLLWPVAGRVRTLQQDAETKILLNGCLLPSFQVGRGVRQGCPLSPLLFALVTVPLIERIRSANREGNIKMINFARDAGVSCSGEVVKYLGAMLVTKHHGVDNRGRVLESISNHAKFYSSPLLPFESRIIVFRHAVFASIIYSLMNTSFKKKTLRRAECVLRDYVWGKSRDGKQKRALTAWDSVTLPRRWGGGLGFFKPFSFQKALFCKTLLAACANPLQTVWGPIFASEFLQVDPTSLVEGLCTQRLPDGGRRYPVSALLISSWKDLWTNFRWSLLVCQVPSSLDLDRAVFLIARTRRGVSEAEAVMDDILKICRRENVFSISELLNGHTQIISRYNVQVSEPVRETLLLLRSFTVGADQVNFSQNEWLNESGEGIKLTWRASEIYLRAVREEREKQTARMNARWRCNWGTEEWERMWRSLCTKGLSERHRCFLWRVMTKSLYDGRKEYLMGWSGFSCSFCGGEEVEDVNHIFLHCQRWNRCWQEVERKMPGWRELSQLRADAANIPQLIRGILSGSSTHRLFKLWWVALMWRCFWTERCALKYRRQQNTMQVARIAYTFLEEIWARRQLLGEERSRTLAQQLLPLIPVIPARYEEIVGEF